MVMVSILWNSQIYVACSPEVYFEPVVATEGKPSVPLEELLYVILPMYHKNYEFNTTAVVYRSSQYFSYVRMYATCGASQMSTIEHSGALPLSLLSLLPEDVRTMPGLRERRRRCMVCRGMIEPASVSVPWHMTPSVLKRASGTHRGYTADNIPRFSSLAALLPVLVRVC